MPDNNSDYTIPCLMHAIEDKQGTIRAYDIKAQILAGFLAIVIGFTNYEYNQRSVCYPELIIISWMMGLTAIIILGLVLYPKKNPFEKLSLGSYVPQQSYFMHDITSSPGNTVDVLLDKAENTNWGPELVYENMKLSVIRDRKHVLFVWALRLSGISILFVAISMIVNLSHV